MIEAEGLFTENNHSSFEIRWRLIPVGDFNEVAGLARHYYGIENIVDIQEVDEWGHNSNNFRVTYTVGDHDNQILLRKHIRLTDPHIIEDIESVCAHLDARGVRVSRVLRSSSGQLTIEKGDQRWSASTFISGDHFSGAPEELTEMGVGVARLVQGLRDYPVRLGRLVSPEWDLDMVRNVFVRIRDLSPDLGADVDRNGERFLMLAETMQRERVTQHGADQLLHNDLHPFNTLFENGRLQAIIDFDNMRYGDFRIDVALALHRFVRQHVVWSEDRSDERVAAGVKIFLDAYTSFGELSHDDIEALPTFMRESLFRKISFDLRALLESSNASRHVGEAKKFLTLLKETDVLESHLHAYANHI